MTMRGREIAVDSELNTRNTRPAGMPIARIRRYDEVRAASSGGGRVGECEERFRKGEHDDADDRECGREPEGLADFIADLVDAVRAEQMAGDRHQRDEGMPVKVM